MSVSRLCCCCYILLKAPFKSLTIIPRAQTSRPIPANALVPVGFVSGDSRVFFSSFVFCWLGTQDAACKTVRNTLRMTYGSGRPQFIHPPLLVWSLCKQDKAPLACNPLTCALCSDKRETRVRRKLALSYVFIHPEYGLKKKKNHVCDQAWHNEAF